MVMNNEQVEKSQKKQESEYNHNNAKETTK